MRTADEIARRILTAQRTRWEGQEPRDDETLAAAYEALRERCEDLELIARAAIDPEKGVVPLDQPANSWHVRASYLRSFTLRDDGTGLPVLTDDARAALRGEAKP